MSASFISLACVRARARASALPGSEPPELSGDALKSAESRKTQIPLMIVCVDNLPDAGRQTEWGRSHALTHAAPLFTSSLISTATCLRLRILLFWRGGLEFSVARTLLSADRSWNHIWRRGQRKGPAPSGLRTFSPVHPARQRHRPVSGSQLSALTQSHLSLQSRPKEPSCSTDTLA